MLFIDMLIIYLVAFLQRNGIPAYGTVLACLYSVCTAEIAQADLDSPATCSSENEMPTHL